MPPRLSGDRRNNHRTLKGILREHKTQSKKRSGRLHGVQKKHEVITNTLKNMRTIVSTFVTQIDEVREKTYTTRTLSPEQMRRMQASNTAVTKALGEMTVQLRNFNKRADNEEEASRRVAALSEKYRKEQEVLVLQTARWMSEIAAEIANAEGLVRHNAPLKADTQPIDESGRVVTTLMQLHAPDRTFRDPTDTIFTTPRGSGARRPNLPGTPAARARAAQGVSAVKPIAEGTEASAARNSKDTIEDKKTKSSPPLDNL